MKRNRRTKGFSALLSFLLLVSLCMQSLVMAAQPSAEQQIAKEGQISDRTTVNNIQVTPTAEVTPELSVETPGSPEVTVQPTVEVTATPEVTPQPSVEIPATPEVTPEATLEVTPEITPMPDGMANAVEVKITSWQWNDAEQVLRWSATENRWEMLVPGASETTPLTKEQLLQMLPKTILVQVVKEGVTTQEELPITWDVTQFPEQTFQGEHVMKATLPQGYVLDPGVGNLEATVVLNTANTLAIDPKYTVKGESPHGTIINLFDYWTGERRPAGGDYHDGYATHKELGINKGHQLKFTTGGDKYINQWTGSAKPRSKMVDTTLEGGYPCLISYADKNVGLDRRESLSYLFDTSVHEGKMAFPKVKNLLQIDQDGYYYYDSVKNFAEFDEATNQFTLYEKSGVNPNSADSDVGQFFPFNKGSEVLEVVNGELMPKKDAKSTDKIMNHYFGCTMSTRFVQQYGGYTKRNGGKQVTYTFSGDDDVWVFIDGVLVADLGGIHSKGSLSINFATGKIYINGQEDGNLRSKFEAANKSTSSFVWNKNIFKDDTFHTLDFYYLERGNVDSNMSLKFNLVTIPESDIVKVDQLGYSVPGAEFKLYKADRNYQYSTRNLIATGITGQDGRFVLVDQQGYIISLQDLYNQRVRYLVLKETGVPSGYRDPGPIQLELLKREKGVILKCRNPLVSGAYSSAKVVTTAPDEVFRYIDGEAVDYRNGNGMLFAVVMKYVPKPGSTSMEAVENWHPLYGDAINGWNISTTYTMDEIIKAAQKDLYAFEMSSSGNYKVEIDNLPGDIETYYYMHDPNQPLSEVKFSIAYFYTEATEIANATKANTYRVVDELFERDFAARLLVPNIANYFLVQKLDENGLPVPSTVGSATFELYAEKDVELSNGSYQVRPGAKPYDTQVTKDRDKSTGDLFTIKSAAGFPGINAGSNAIISTAGIPNGTYFLRESIAPPGYKRSEEWVKIIVSSTGVYAHAGKANDGITVQVGPGSLVKSLLQYTNGNVDNTLEDIIVTLRTSADAKQWIDTNKVVHMCYRNSSELLEYGPVLKPDNTPWDGDVSWPEGMSNDEGFTTVKIAQWYEGESGNPGDKNKITMDDISNLFGESVIVKVVNKKVNSLLVSKAVTGTLPQGENPVFDFTVELKDAKGQPITGTFATTKTTGTESNTGTITITNGIGTFQLKDKESLEINGLDPGIQYKVTEKEVSPYSTKVQVNQEPERVGFFGEGTIPANGNGKVAFTNHYTAPAVLTGVTALKGQKTLIGRNLEATDRFEFQLVAADQPTTDAITAGNVVIANALTSVTGDGTTSKQTFTFGDVTFKTEGTYKFYVSEVVPDPNSTGIQYDTHKSEITVVVTKDAVSNDLVAAVTYNNKSAITKEDQEDTTQATFTNMTAKEFAFKKTDKDGNPLQGAKFVLYQLDCKDGTHTHDTLLYVNSNGDLTGESATNSCWSKLMITESEGTTGLATLKGLLPSKEYRLIEYVTPNGYVLPGGQWILKYNANLGVFEPTGSINNPPAFEVHKQNGVVTGYSVINYKPSELPFTGNTGIHRFLLLGGALMAVGAVFMILLTWKKKRMIRE